LILSIRMRSVTTNGAFDEGMKTNDYRKGRLVHSLRRPFVTRQTMDLGNGAANNGI
jgi:hypothetical protein